MRTRSRRHDPAEAALPAAQHWPERDKPWLFRTYAGHSTAAKSNELYRNNLAKGQTGLSIAFDLPTQTGYDSDHELARGEVGKVGVPVSHLGDMRALLAGIPLGEMNTSMTINATAAWLLALYVAVADEQGAPRTALTGTIQNDIIKEYLSRGTYVFPPEPSLRLIKDTIVFTCRAMPKWNPINVCSYHLQEAGATPVQELAFALATALAVLDAREGLGRGGAATTSAPVVGRISFFVNAGAPLHHRDLQDARLHASCGTRSRAERYGVTDAKHRLFRYGVQVNSLGLTEQQAENNVYRILLEMLAVTLSKDARARAVQLPAWNEALGLPRPWDQQWSLRMQQILAYETDLLEYADIFDGSKVDRAQGRRAQGRGQGGARAHRRHGRRRGGHRLHEARAGREQHRARCAASRRASRSSSASTAGPRRSPRRCPPARARSWPSIPAIEARADRAPRGLARGARRQGREGGAGRARARRQGRPQRHGAVDRLRQGRRHHRRVGRDAARACSASTARRPASRGGVAGDAAAAASSEVRARGRARVGAGSAGASSCWSASPASTATPTAPSRSRCARATAAWRWSTRASA